MAWLSHEAEVYARSGQSTLTSSRSRLQWRAEQSVLATRDDAPNNSTQLRRQAQLPRKIEIAEPSRASTEKCTRLCCSGQPKGCISAAASLCSRVGKLSQEHLPLLQLLRAPNGRLRHPNLCAQARRSEPASTAQIDAGTEWTPPAEIGCHFRECHHAHAGMRNHMVHESLEQHKHMRFTRAEGMNTE
jgi:hypothetical protein